MCRTGGVNSLFVETVELLVSEQAVFQSYLPQIQISAMVLGFYLDPDSLLPLPYVDHVRALSGPKVVPCLRPRQKQPAGRE